MAQAGAHAIIGMYTAKIPFIKKNLTASIIIGSLIPDLDIFSVAFGARRGSGHSFCIVFYMQISNF